MKKLLLSIIITIGFLGLNITYAETCINYYLNAGYNQTQAEYKCNAAPPALTGWCDGTGSNIQYNTMPWSSRWYYINSDEWISLGDIWSCFNENGCGNSNSVDASCAEGIYGDLRLKEENFITGRKCINNCSGNDPLHSYVEGSPSSSQPKYNLNISNNITIGDKIRVLVYLHNTAKANQYPTDDTKIVINWNESNKKIESIISYSTNNGGSYTNRYSNDLTLPNLANNVKLVPTSLSRLNAHGQNSNYEVSNLSPGNSGFTVNQDGKTLTYDINSHNSCFYHRKFIYFDFDVVFDPPPASFIIEKSSPTAGTIVQSGDIIDYTITVTNDGDSDINNLIITDQLDSNVSFESGSGANYDPNNHTVSFNLGTLPEGGTFIRTFQVKVNDNTVGDSICNLAINVNGNGTSNGNPVNAQLQDDICHNLEQIPHFTLNKAAISPPVNTIVDSNDEIIYSITVHNDGDLQINQNLMVTDILDPNLEFIQAVEPNGNIITYNTNNNTVTINFHYLPISGPNSTKTASFKVKVKDNYSSASQVCNLHENVNGSGPTSAGTVYSQAINDICHYLPTPPSSFFIEKTSPNTGETVHPGDPIQYTLTITNNGDTNINNLIVTDILDPNVSYVSGGTYNSSTHTVTLDFDVVGPGQTDSQNINVEVINSPIGDSLCNYGYNVEAIGYSPSGEQIIDNPDGDICHYLPTPPSSFFIEKTSPNTGETVHPGDPIQYTLTITNNGDTNINNLIVTDILDPNVSYVSGGTYNSSTHTVTLDFDVVGPGQTDSQNINVEVINSPIGDSLCNYGYNVEAIGYSPSGEQIIDNPDGDICHYLPTPPLYKITKNDNLPTGEVYQIDQEFDYEINIQNINNTLIPQIIVTDILPDELEFINSNDPNISYNESSHTVTLTFLNIVQQNTSKSFTVKVKDTASPCNDICNTVTSSFGQSGINNEDEQINTPLNSNSVPSNGFLDQISNWGQNLWNSITNITNNLFTSIIKIATASEQPTPPSSYDPSTDQFCRPMFCTGSINISKDSIPVPGAHVSNGNEITYFITVTNPLTTTLNNIIVEDILEENLIFAGSDYPEVSNNGQTVQLNFEEIEPLNYKTLSFKAIVVIPDELPEEICNFASYDTGNMMIPSNEVCHPYGEPVCGNGIVEEGESCDLLPLNLNLCNADCTTPGHGGPTPTPTIDVCTETDSNTTLSCLGKTPDRSNPYLWQFWQNCLATGKDKTICLHEWAEEAGFTAMGFCSANSDCNDPILPDDCIVGGCSILEGQIEKSFIKSNVSANQDAGYNIVIWLKNTTTQPVTIQLTDLKVYDLSVPTNSGWIWNRVLNEASENWSLVSNANGINYFKFNNPGSIVLQPGLKTEISRNLSYSMNTSLTIKADTAQIKNVAFAAIKFIAPYYSVVDGFIDNRQTQFFNLRLNEFAGQNQSQELCDENGIPLPNFFYGATSTYGDTAIVKIDRPYVEVRKGADLGIAKYNAVSNPFGGYLNDADKTGDNLDSDSSGEKINNFNESTDYLFDNFRENLTNNTMSFGGATFSTTDDNSNVWFYDGQDGPVIISNDSLTFNKPITFVISNTNLIIENDFILDNKFAAFIVEDGNILVGENVNSIEGMFIANGENSEIKSNGNKESKIQLEINGAIMGNSNNLLQNRIYIGNDNSGKFVLEPSIKINYDLRLLNGTPPALESFLGEGSIWGQEY